jgi:hypothetical protein
MPLRPSLFRKSRANVVSTSVNAEEENTHEQCLIQDGERIVVLVVRVAVFIEASDRGERLVGLVDIDVGNGR